jgi:hypothetical protein
MQEVIDAHGHQGGRNGGDRRWDLSHITTFLLLGGPAWKEGSSITPMGVHVVRYDLYLGTVHCTTDQRDPEYGTGPFNEPTGRKIIGAIRNDVALIKDPPCVSAVHEAWLRHHINVPRMNAGLGSIHFQHTNVIGPVQELTIQVPFLYGVAIDDRERAQWHCGQQGQQR